MSKWRLDACLTAHRVKPRSLTGSSGLCRRKEVATNLWSHSHPEDDASTQQLAGLLDVVTIEKPFRMLRIGTARGATEMSQEISEVQSVTTIQ